MAHSGGTTQAFYDDNQNIDDASPDSKVFFYKKRFDELQAEFEEYQFSSRELENELETQLSHCERRIRDLESKNVHLLTENETLRIRLEKLTAESQRQTSELQDKLGQVTAINEQLSTHIRELEQSNDDLERAKRHLDTTLADFDAKLNEQIERNELLESEIGEKEELQVVIQRLKDEARDLRLELMIQKKGDFYSGGNRTKSHSLSSPETETAPTPPHNHHISPAKRTPTNSFSVTSTTASVGVAEPIPDKSCNNNHTTTAINTVISNNAITTTTNASSPNTLSSNKTTNNQIPLLSASSRISALNIVSDLLRKVGALESKLASCRNIMPPTVANIKGTTTSSPTSNGKTATVENNNESVKIQ